MVFRMSTNVHLQASLSLTKTYTFIEDICVAFLKCVCRQLVLNGVFVF